MHSVALSLSIPRGQAYKVTSPRMTGSVFTTQSSRVANFFLGHSTLCTTEENVLAWFGEPYKRGNADGLPTLQWSYGRVDSSGSELSTERTKWCTLRLIQLQRVSRLN
jgi:hypothetical protein